MRRWGSSCGGTGFPPACRRKWRSRDGAPVKVRLLGEDLVVFRDSDGRLGVLDEYCPHRRVSLAYGRNEECGLRCLYHGWKMDVDGNVLEMASEPPQSGFVEKVKTKAYPAREAGGFVWTYMGPANEMPEFEPPAFAPTPTDARLDRQDPCRLQLGADPRRRRSIPRIRSSLHSSDMKPAKVDAAKATDTHWLRPSTDKAPRLQVERTSFGFHYAAIRRPIVNAQTHDYIRKTVYVAPFTALIPPNNEYNVATVLTPDRRHAHGVPLHRLERERRHRSGGVAQVQCRAARHRSRSPATTICARARMTTSRTARR